LEKAKQAHQIGGRVISPEHDFEDTIERVNYSDLSETEFLQRFEFGSRPAIIRGVADNWRARTEWTFAKLIERFGTSKFKIGESDSGRKLKVTLN
jgi:histone arginine demethylase JMJD6